MELLCYIKQCLNRLNRLTVKPVKLFSLKSSIVDAYRVLNKSLATIELPAGNYMFKVTVKTQEQGVKYIFKGYNKDTRTMPLVSFWCLYR